MSRVHSPHTAGNGEHTYVNNTSDHKIQTDLESYGTRHEPYGNYNKPQLEPTIRRHTKTHR